MYVCVSLIFFLMLAGLWCVASGFVVRLFWLFCYFGCLAILVFFGFYFTVLL